MEEKRKPGQPPKADAKKHYKTRLHPDVIKIIQEQPNQAKFIEELVLASKKI